MRKLFNILLIGLLAACSLFAASSINFIVGQDDPLPYPAGQSRAVSRLPAVFSYIPEGNVNFKANSAFDTTFNGGAKAVAKLGTLTLVDWNTGDDVSYRRGTTSERLAYKVFNPNLTSLNYIYQLYMGYGEDGAGNADSAFNTVTLSYTDNDGGTGTFLADMYSVANTTAHDSSNPQRISGAAGSNNPRLLGQNGKMFVGQSIDFYLVSREDFNTLDAKINVLDRSLSVEGNVRNIFQWVYKLNNVSSYEDRYYTGEDITTDPFSILINQQKEPDDIVFSGTDRAKDDWSFSLFATYYAEHLLLTDNLQKIADGTLVSNSGASLFERYITYTITDSIANDNAFKLHHWDGVDYFSPEQEIPYTIYFTEHSKTDPIVEGKEYLFPMPALKTQQNAEMYVGDIASGAEGATGGIWHDTITITITPVESAAGYEQ